MTQEIAGTNGQAIALDVHAAKGVGGERRGVLLLMHGFKGFKDWGFFPYVAETLSDVGFDVVRFNSSHNGVGLGDDRTDFTRLDLFRQNRSSYEVADIMYLVEALRLGQVHSVTPCEASEIILMGHSRGGGAMIAAAAQVAVRGVVTWASVATLALPAAWAEAFQRDGFVEILNGRTGQMMPIDRTASEDVNPMPLTLDIEHCMSQASCPHLVLHGTADSSVPLDAATAISTAGGERVERQLIDAADHVMNARHPFVGTTPELETALKVTTAFLKCL